MTSRQESSKSARPRAADSAIESLAGQFHPHAIEIQDFAYYALIVDVRSASEYDNDHIPGAVRLAPGRLADADEAPPTTSVLGANEPAPPLYMPRALATLVESIKLDQAILVYCGRGGRDSRPVAKALRWQGYTVDVLPGGWINYRRWVQAGLEMLPRLIPFQVVSAALASEAARWLAALAQAGQQVLDLDALAGWRSSGLAPSPSAQAPQAWFESRLLQALRQIDPRRSVWVADRPHARGPDLARGTVRRAGGSAHQRPRVCAAGEIEALA